MVGENITGTDKLLICLALILLLTIVWTILIGILYKMNERKYRRVEKKKIIDDDYDIDDDDEYEYNRISFKKRDKYKSRKSSDYETYVKIRFYRSKRDLIYVAPDDIELVEGQKIKVRVDEDTVRSAVVVKGNYTREKYKTYEYNTLDVEEY
jgi:hypothetical protein